MATSEPTVLIIGGGTFGVSTAYHLAQTYKDPSRVTLIDREPSPPSHAAAIDINRIVRADYPSTLYCNLANEAIHPWFWSNELGPCFHRVGWLMLDEHGSDLQDRIFSTLRGRGTHIMQDVDLATISQGKRWEVTKGTDTTGFARAYFNPDAGWVDAANATRRFLETAVRKGVQRLVGDVRELLVDKSRGRLYGVLLADGKRLVADKVVLAAGAWTSALLSPVEDALRIPEEESIERQAQATAIVSAYYRVSDGDVARMTECEMPCIIFGRTGEVIPAWNDNGLLKYNNSVTKVVNTMAVGASGRRISVPVKDQRTVPEGWKRETEALLTSKLMSQFARGSPNHWRICWDSYTPTEDLLLCQHPKISGLYIITGGSFCGYKYVIAMFKAQKKKGLCGGRLEY